MKKSVTIARALKEKNRIAGELAKVRKILSQKNSHERGDVLKLDLKKLYEQEERLVGLLVKTKAKIALANKDIVSKIIELSETKSRLAWISAINTFEGSSGTYSNKSEYIAELDELKQQEWIKKLQRRANQLQDQLDEHNGVRHIEIEMEEEDNDDAKSN